jgi:hypothetical protein
VYVHTSGQLHLLNNRYCMVEYLTALTFLHCMLKPHTLSTAFAEVLAQAFAGLPWLESKLRSRSYDRELQRQLWKFTQRS